MAVPPGSPVSSIGPRGKEEVTLEIFQGNTLLSCPHTMATVTKHRLEGTVRAMH